MKTGIRATSPAVVALGAELRAARLQARFGLRELAKRAGLSPGHLTNWEAGYRTPPPDMLSFLLGLLKLPQAEYTRLRDLAASTHSTMHAVHLHAGSVRMMHAYEQVATTIAEWSPTFLPTHLQTRDYTWEMLEHTTPPGASPESYFFDLSTTPALAKAGSATRKSIVGRRSLRNPVISRETSIVQHEHLLRTLAREPQTIRLLTAEQEDLPGFTIYTRTDQRPTVALQHSHTTVYLTSEEAVSDYADKLGHLADRALSPAETKQYLTERIRELQTGYR
ncbi:Scr1 family TA system antitoxin-like transcriptional regulator [Amycolatopsis sp. NPDC005232]|uniref:Scr1 family TA system antitoxin-like transcriptional regulator n=1 Tax=Amycolatopsis sp. NPDC005232 TaxID=3157027 RepID=UPI0033A1A7B0